MKQNTEKKLKISIAISVVLCVALCITSFALAILASALVEKNTFATGVVDVDISEKSSSVATGFGPGMSLDRTYVVQNSSPVGVWYKVCFEEVKGDLKDVILVKVKENKEGGAVLFEGWARDFVKENEKNIKIGEAIPANGSRDVLITFTFPEDAGDEYQGKELCYDIQVRAVQQKNIDHPGEIEF